MNVDIGTVGVTVALASLVSGGIGVYVTRVTRSIATQFKNSLDRFKNEFIKELDDRYVRTREHNQERIQIMREEGGYRSFTKEKIEGVAIEVFRDRDSVNIILKDILSILKNETPPFKSSS
jgi:hypothetical protein